LNEDVGAVAAIRGTRISHPIKIRIGLVRIRSSRAVVDISAYAIAINIVVWVVRTFVK
jgi:hypothetical protein